MGACTQCGKTLVAGQMICSECDQQPIRVAGEVIPPSPPEAEAEKPGRPKSFTTALLVAIFADLFQIVFFPMFAQGVLSPLDDALDVAVGAAMTYLIGWHWAFLPSFLGKLAPFLDELPCWTLAVLYVRAERGRLQSV
jgi:hypothetical protein